MTTISETLSQLLTQLDNQSIQFSDVISYIDQYYQHTPTAFDNGNQHNEEQQNQGSAKVLYFAQLNQLTPEQTLSLFAEHYQSVLKNPNGDDHQNIRQFMQHGWSGVKFSGQALQNK